MRHVPIETVDFNDCVDAKLTRALESVRHLPERFPDAGLRTVAVLRAPTFDRKADPSGRTKIWMALENLQITGSFKVRGALCAVDDARMAGHTHVVAASAGNHGVGVAHAARALGLQARIFVPETASKTKIDKMVAAGAIVDFCEEGYDEAERAARKAASSFGCPFISPYEDQSVCLGNGASLAFEISEYFGEVPSHLLVPIGGGGLAAGLALGASYLKKLRAPIVWTAQSEASAAFALSLERGLALESLAPPAGGTLAEGLEGGISQTSFDRARRLVLGVTVATEKEIAKAMGQASEKLRIRLEGSAAVALVPLLAELPNSLKGGNLVIVLTGRNVDEATFSRAVPPLTASGPSVVARR
jgi:threonine dehydratase